MIAVSTSPRPTEVSFVVRGNPVSQNQAWRIALITPKSTGVQHATLMLTPEGAAFKFEVHRIATLVVPRDWDRTNEYEIWCTYYFDSRRPDLDGPGKLLLDALGDFKIRKTQHRGPVYANDRQVWRFTQQKELDQVNPRAEITIRLRRPWKPQQGALL